MTPGARLQSAIQLLDTVEAASGPADRAIFAWLRQRRFIGSKDRRAILDRIFWVLRHRAALDWWLARAGDGGSNGPGSEAAAGADGAAAGPSRRRLIAALALSGEADPAQLKEIFNGGRYAPAPLDEAEARVAERLAGQPLEHPDQPRCVGANYPEWLDPLLAARFGERLGDEIAALNEPAPFDLRVNTLKATREDARAALRADGVEAEPTPLSPLGLRLPRRRPLGGLESFERGLVEVQDEGAQVVSLLVDARPGMRVVDFCAGAGGKTLALAAAMGNRGWLAALDVSSRINRAEPRLRRAGVDITALRLIQPHDDPWIADHAASADRVLLDAPCTRLGAWRRDPAARWRLEPRDLERRVALQRSILDEACCLVRPGGRLVYATCSLLREENEDQVAGFLAAHGDFRPVPVPDVWAETVGGACPGTGPHLQLTPASHGTDGFFAAVMERKP
jgi:16S rRNA (cytosine967-C5)-methyltransferase